MTHSAVVIRFVPRREREIAVRPPRTARTTAMGRTSNHLTRIAALLGIPEEAFFREMPGSGRATPDPLELSELVEVFRRIENPDDRRRVLEVAKSTLGQGGVAESSPMHGRGRLPPLNATGFPGDGTTIER